MGNVKGKSTFPCPTCHTDLVFTPKVIIKAHLASAFKDVDGDSDRESSLTQSFQCPDCLNQIQVRYSLEIKEVFVPSRETSAPEHAPMLMSPEQVALMRRMREAGLIEAFSKVVVDMFNGNGRTPKNMETYFLGFLDNLVPERPSPEVFREISNSLVGEGNISFWKSLGIVMVVTSKEGVRCFYPARRAESSAKELKIDGIVLNKSSSGGIKNCGLGLVPKGSRIFLASLRQSLGHRGREMSVVPLR